MILGEATRVMSPARRHQEDVEVGHSDYNRASTSPTMPTAIALKIRQAKSDSILGYLRPGASRPEASNLLTIFAALAERPRGREWRALYAGRLRRLQEPLWPTCGREAGADRRLEMRRLQADPGHLDRILRDGAERAAAIAEKVLAQAYDAVGFLRVSRPRPSVSGCQVVSSRVRP